MQASKYQQHTCSWNFLFENSNRGFTFSRGSIWRYISNEGCPKKQTKREEEIPLHVNLAPLCQSDLREFVNEFHPPDIKARKQEMIDRFNSITGCVRLSVFLVCVCVLSEVADAKLLRTASAAVLVLSGYSSNSTRFFGGDAAPAAVAVEGGGA